MHICSYQVLYHTLLFNVIIDVEKRLEIIKKNIKSFSLKRYKIRDCLIAWKSVSAGHST